MRLEHRVEITYNVDKTGFQFHKGAIRTFPSIRDFFRDTYFNSIKVRLERAVAICQLAIYLYFNSIKVRLERALVAEYSKPNKFQFHKGAIRTQRDRFRVIPEENFNSIKVRLEHGNVATEKLQLLISIP